MGNVHEDVGAMELRRLEADYEAELRRIERDWCDGWIAALSQFWCTGSRDRADGKDEESYCAVIDASSEAAIWQAIAKHYPDYEARFCTPCEPDWTPNDRFPVFENRTLLEATDGQGA